MTPTSDDEFPDSIAVPDRSTRSTKRKSGASSDVSDGDLTPPAKKKPGPKPKVKPAADVEDSGTESEPKPPKKKSGPKPQPKAKAKPGPKPKKSKKNTSSDDEDIEVVKPTPEQSKIIFIVPEAATEGSQRLSLKSVTSFDDAIEIMHETIGCVSVERKPMLTYKFSTANKNATTINLRTEDDWDGLVSDVLAKMKTKKDISVNIFVLPENYMLSLRHSTRVFILYHNYTTVVMASVVPEEAGPGLPQPDRAYWDSLPSTSSPLRPRKIWGIPIAFFHIALQSGSCGE
ncbi:hypothetical protein K438DRAFT_2019434 [Mycena galopus ATCC 62051]|nr:hypothetical protein K438DRAFT_2019434 [Mycena galopus ATCC 62051]